MKQTKQEKRTKRTEIRTERMNLRLSRTEKEMFQNKASRAFHGNMTQMVAYAVKMLNENRLDQKFKLISLFSESCNKILFELKKSGTNINQIAHQLNALMKEYDGRPECAMVKRCLDSLVSPGIKRHNETLLHVENAFTAALNELMCAP